MDVQQVVIKLQAVWQQVLADPLALPMAGSLTGLVLCIGLLYWCAVAGERSQKKRAEAAGGTVFEGGVRRSTRAHKQPEHYSPEKETASPALAKTPRATRTPKTATKEAKEALTVTPRATRARTTRTTAKTPATVEAPPTRTRRAAAKTPAK